MAFQRTRRPALMGLVWLGGALTVVGMSGALTLKNIESLKPDVFRDPVAQENLRYARLFVGTMAIGAIVAVLSALKVGG